MPKKKKPKRGLSGKSASSSPSSSDSTQSSGATKQASGKILAGSSPIKLELAAAIADGSVDLQISDLDLALESRVTEQNIIDVTKQASDKTSATDASKQLDLAATNVVGSVDLPNTDLSQEPQASEQNSPEVIETPTKDSRSSLSIPAVAQASAGLETPSAQAAIAANPENETAVARSEPPHATATANSTPSPVNKPTDQWVGLFKGKGKKLEKKGTPFALPSGEMCIKIPNSIIEKNKKSWEAFVIGQFYSDPPAQSLIHTIVNGIWSKQYKDITVSKLEGNAFLFRIPNVGTRNHVINQRLWQIEGQTMFVAHWEPGNLPEKPALSSAPIWLELRNVPLQFFNEDGLERIAGLVGHPKYLHPATVNKTNLEVAKVLTLIDPRKPLPEAVNVQFESGDISRVTVSSPWMPPVCSHCKEIGHSIKRCPSAPITCTTCKSTSHSTEVCTRTRGPDMKKAKRPRRHASNSKHADPPRGKSVPPRHDISLTGDDSIGQPPDPDKGKGIATSDHPPNKTASAKSPAIAKGNANQAGTSKANGHTSVSEVESDSDDIPSSDSDVEEGQYIPVKTRHRTRFGRDRGPKAN